MQTRLRATSTSTHLCAYQISQELLLHKPSSTSNFSCMYDTQRIHMKRVIVAVQQYLYDSSAVRSLSVWESRNLLQYGRPGNHCARARTIKSPKVDTTPTTCCSSSASGCSGVDCQQSTTHVQTKESRRTSSSAKASAHKGATQHQLHTKNPQVQVHSNILRVDPITLVASFLLACSTPQV